MKYKLTPRKVEHEPIVPVRDGKTPTWVVSCLDCAFSHDAHGAEAQDAIDSIAPRHQAGHKLIARSINYDEGWPTSGHPLYHR